MHEDIASSKVLSYLYREEQRQHERENICSSILRLSEKQRHELSVRTMSVCIVRSRFEGNAHIK